MQWVDLINRAKRGPLLSSKSTLLCIAYNLEHGCIEFDAVLCTQINLNSYVGQNCRYPWENSESSRRCRPVSSSGKFFNRTLRLRNLDAAARALLRDVDRAYNPVLW